MALLSLRGISFSWTTEKLLDELNFDINQGERIGLIGRNGVGKSTLMKVMSGEIQADHGGVVREPHLRIARLEQEVPTSVDARVFDLVANGLREQSAEELEDWQVEQAVKTALSRTKLDGEAIFGSLSSGLKRRVLLATALVNQPQILFLDEPTNHLDIESIMWLEGFLKNFEGAIVFVTHDRVFMQNLATRIIEIDRGRIFDWTCDFETFLKRKAAVLEAEAKQAAEFDKKLAQEEIWIRQGIKARRTRNEGRVRALKKMRVERSERREQIGNVRMRAVEAEKSGQLVLEATDLSFSYDDSKTIIKPFNLLLTRGEKVGIIGPNGAGKSTLLKLLLKQLEPTEGKIRHGTRLELIYFDQLREQLDEEKTVEENVAEGNDHVTVNGQKKHVLGYLQEFLFPPSRARQKTKFLSGGERNRVLMARLFKKSSNLMVLDEPTNDLDAETLELLEELVSDYQGTILLVSHDRAFLNNVVTSTLYLSGDGAVKQFHGGYDDFLRHHQHPADSESSKSDSKKTKKGKQKKDNAENTASDAPIKLSYKEKRELESLPEKIETLETEKTRLHDEMSDPEYFKRDPAEISKASDRLKTIEAELEDSFARWDELESRA